MKSFRSVASALAAAALVVSAPVLAHPKLLTATPAEASTTRSVTRITLAFSEPLVAQFSGLEVVMTSMPGMAMAGPHTMKIAGVRVSVAPDGKTLIAALARPLAAGTYVVNWHAVSKDTHKIAGKLTFTVR